MISREWLTAFLTTHLTRARVETDRPIPPVAEGMTAELVEKWLEGEATYWLAAAEKRGIPVQRRMLLLQVSRFYDARLLALRREQADRS
jgi:hypothetical protein